MACQNHVFFRHNTTRHHSVIFPPRGTGRTALDSHERADSNGGSPVRRGGIWGEGFTFFGFWCFGSGKWNEIYGGKYRKVGDRHFWYQPSPNALPLLWIADGGSGMPSRPFGTPGEILQGRHLRFWVPAVTGLATIPSISKTPAQKRHHSNQRAIRSRLVVVPSKSMHVADTPPGYPAVVTERDGPPRQRRPTPRALRVAVLRAKRRRIRWW